MVCSDDRDWLPGAERCLLGIVGVWPSVLGVLFAGSFMRLVSACVCLHVCVCVLSGCEKSL